MILVINGQPIDIPGGASEVYSTEERQVGFWIDGKPLYRKVVQFEVDVSGAWTIAYPEIPNAEMRFMDGYINRRLDAFCKIAPLGQSTASLLYNTENPDIPKGLLYWVSHTPYFGPAYAVLTYTKTTDEATR